MNVNCLIGLPINLGSTVSYIIIVFAICFGTSCQQDQDPDNQYTTWRDYGGGADQSKFVKLNGIDKANVNQLEVEWTYSTEDENSYQFNPIIVDTVMYILAKNYSLIALDARTGEEIWIHTDLRGIARRGINYWENENGSDKRLLFQMNDYLQAIDAETGESILEFGEDGLVDLRQNLPPRDPKTIHRIQSGTPGKIFENLIILGSSPGEGYLSAPGHIRAYDVITGELAWIFHTIPQPGEYGYDTWPEDAYKYVGGVNTWSEITVDETRGIAYFPLGSPTYDYYGADRVGMNLFGNSILALDARTGERLWHYQLVHHDLWDYDLTSAPQLTTVNHEGEEIDAIAVATKHGFLFAFDRVSGEPLWPIEERPVPESHVPGEEAWPTQPFPTQLPPFARQRIDPDSLTSYFLTEDELTNWKKKLEEFEELGRTGLFTPLSHKYETVSVPSAVGGANLAMTAANPEEGMVYVMSQDRPSFYPPLEKREYEPDDHQGEEASVVGMNSMERGFNIYAQECQACHGENRTGIGNTPSLVDMITRVSYEDFQQVVRTGRGEMPAFSHLSEEELESIYRYLGGTTDGDVVERPKGPVVASGGVPGSQYYRPADRSGGRLGPPYPEGVDAFDRYYIDGWGLTNPYIMSPPWSSITAYDLNKGTIKWKIPLGEDKLAAEEGGENTGMPATQRKGMIVTSTGLLFATAKDGKIRAFDADNGEELWVAKLPMGTEGIPAMYEIDNKYYLVLSATVPLVWGDGVPEYDEESGDEKPQGSYIVFSLPE